MIVWTHAVLGVLYACALYFCICTCSAQVGMFNMERRSRNIITIIILLVVFFSNFSLNNLHTQIHRQVVAIIFSQMLSITSIYFCELKNALCYTFPLFKKNPKQPLCTGDLETPHRHVIDRQQYRYKPLMIIITTTAAATTTKQQQ